MKEIKEMTMDDLVKEFNLIQQKKSHLTYSRRVMVQDMVEELVKRGVLTNLKTE